MILSLVRGLKANEVWGLVFFLLFCKVNQILQESKDDFLSQLLLCILFEKSPGWLKGVNVLSIAAVPWPFKTLFIRNKYASLSKFLHEEY